MSTLTIDTETLPIVSDPEILGGTTVFKGTRVPVKTLFDYLEDGFSLTAFLDNFPTVKKEDAIRLLGLDVGDGLYLQTQREEGQTTG